MKKSCLLLITAGMLFSCAPKKELVKVPAEIYPYDLKVEVDRESMTLAWKTHGSGLKGGYNIYISTEPLAAKYTGPFLPEDIKPFNPVNFPGDTNPDDGVTYYKAEHLEEGVKYYISVRVVNTDRTLSKPTNEAIAVLGARSEFELAFRYRSDNDGYSFAGDKSVRADAADNDIYYYTRDGADYLASPDRLNGFLRNNRFRILPLKGDFEYIRNQVNRSKDEPADDRVSIKKDDWILVRTADNTYALLHVLSFSGIGEQRTVTLFLAYSSLKNEILF